MICRGCMSSINLQPLFNENLDQYFRQSTGLVVSLDDGLSSFVCATCVRWLYGNNSFRLRCIETEAALRHLHEGLVKTIDSPNECKDVKNDKSPTLQQHSSETKAILEPSSSKIDDIVLESLYDSDEGEFDENESNVNLQQTVEKKIIKSNKQLNKSANKSKKLSKDYDPYEPLIVKSY